MSPESPPEPPRWRAWLSALGPGAIVASLTIGTGELVFSTRAGALFGYGILGWIMVVLVLKWALVLASAHLWVHTDVHPLQSWTRLPGPRGWLPLLLLLLAAPAFPVWVSFHAGTLGALAAAVTDTRDAMQGSAPVLWGLAMLVGVQVLAATGSYARQERFQALVIGVMVASVIVALVLLRPDWADLIGGFFSFGPYAIPDWAKATPEFRERPVWVEITTYAGVVGGSGYDYLAYVAWLRDKHGRAAARAVPPRTLQRMILLDASVSFATVLVFSAVFVACGALILGPQHQIPAGSDLLTLQAQFVEVVGPWLRPLYFTGAFLAMIGTLYGTIEVAPAIVREILFALRADPSLLESPALRRWSVRWCAGGAVLVMI
ncbi:MAG: Nramp family divalent metal transporter, partial [Nitrospira sp.]|nr:Nramp family divalent metal transporter [Nitrospira sp.]